MLITNQRKLDTLRKKAAKMYLKRRYQNSLYCLAQDLLQDRKESNYDQKTSTGNKTISDLRYLDSNTSN